jgi:hypothetical protein
MNKKLVISTDKMQSKFEKLDLAENILKYGLLVAGISFSVGFLIMSLVY